MIYYLVTKPGDHTYRDNPILDEPRLRDRFKIVTYQEAFERRRWRGGTVIFADVDRLPAAAAMRAALLHDRLAEAGSIRLLNHPVRTCRRYAFLRRLRLEGINRHDVYRVDELPKPLTYPVFLRSEPEHDGAYTELLHDAAALHREIDRLIGLGILPQDLLVSEYCHTADADGIYRKATVYVIGDCIFQRYLFFGDHWLVKRPRSPNVTALRSEAALLAEEQSFQGGQQFVPLLRRVAAIAGVQFGRVDFGFVGDRAEIWEINTNPDPAVAAFSAMGGRSTEIVPTGWKLLRDALAALDDDAMHEIRSEIEPPARYEDLYRTMLKESRERAKLPPPE